MNVLILTADFPPIEGGISTLTRELSRELDRLGHSVTVVAPYFPDMVDFDKMEPATVVRFHGYRLGWLRIAPMLMKARERMHWPDIVLGINVGHGGLIAWALKGFYHKSFITFGYAYEFMRFRDTPVISGLLRDVFNDAKAVIAISHFTQEALKDFGVVASHIRTILPGAAEPLILDDSVLELLRDRYLLRDKRVILAVGRFIARKNHVRLVEALPKIVERHPNAVLVLVGQGPEMANTARAAHRVGLREHLRMPGRLSDRDTAALYSICDVFALPSAAGPRGQVEGFGLVFAEANAYGKPVVAGRSGGTSDAVLDGETGLLVDPDNVDEIAAAINRILYDADLAQKLGQAGKARVERELNWGEFATRLSKVMEAP